jgi:hypothetical protein
MGRLGEYFSVLKTAYYTPDSKKVRKKAKVI